MKLHNELVVELYLADRTSTFVCVPGQDTMAMKVVTHIAGQRDDFLVLLEKIHANAAFLVRIVQEWIIRRLVLSKLGGPTRCPLLLLL